MPVRFIVDPNYRYYIFPNILYVRIPNRKVFLEERIHEEMYPKRVQFMNVKEIRVSAEPRFGI